MAEAICLISKSIIKTNTNPKQHIWSKSFTLLFILTIFTQNSFVSIRTIFTAYVQSDLMFTSSMAGVLTGAISVAAFFSRPIAGRLLSGKLQHKYIVVAAEIGSVLIIPLYFYTKTYPLLLLIRALDGFFYGIASACVTAMAGNTLPKERMGSGMATFGLGSMLSLGLSPTVSMVIYNSGGANAVFASCCLTTVMGLFTACLLPCAEKNISSFTNNTKKPKGLGKFLLRRSIPPALLNFISQFAYAGLSTFIVVYGQSRGWENIGTFYLVYAAASFVVRPITGRIYDRHGLTPVVYLTSVSFILSLFTIALTSNIYVCLVSAVFCCFGFCGGWCVFQADAINCDDPADRGRASSTYFIFNDIGAFTGAIVAGYVVTAFGYSGMFMIYSLPLVLMIALYSLRFLRKKSK